MSIQTPPDIRPRFWERIRLEDLTSAEWEALCDCCGKCCLLKLEDEDTGEVSYTSVACRLLDDQTCRCGNYPLRRQLVKTCIVMSPETLADSLDWMPATCAYRLRAGGKPLAGWHPLVSGDPESVHRAGVSVRHRTIPEYDVDEDDLEHFVIEEIL
ncbi:MAG: YcgN family cysteine cluster protein [Paracoccaceae bacterium]